MNTHRPTGSILLLVLVFGSIFFGVLTATSGYVLSENRVQEQRKHKQEAFTIAEAGLNYYRWFLSHYPGDIQNGTGLPGPYEIQYNDPQGGVAGTYTLTISGSTACGATNSVDVLSKGVPTSAPNVSKTLWARYAQPSVAQYSFIVNSSVRVGSTLFGPFHSNGGIRMDGISASPVSSSLTTWLCDNNSGCSPSATQNGVFGVGVDQSLWQFPRPQVDFGAISADFSALKIKAQASGLFYARYSSSGSNNNLNRGYHLVFNANNTVTVYRVNTETVVSATFVSNQNAGFQNEYSIISAETLLGTYPIPSGCSLIYVEDNVWVEGTIGGKVTLVVADQTNVGVVPHTFLRNNILYSAFDGTVGLTLISEGDVLIAPNVPTNLTLDGIFISQSGAYGFNRYTCASGYATKTSLTVLGTIVSLLRPVTAYGSTCSGVQVGFANRVTAFDRQNSTNPPPFTPVTSTQYQFVDWREM